MSRRTRGLLVGGFLPALLFGTAGVLAKAGTLTGLGVGPYLVFSGTCMTLVGIGFCYLLPRGRLSLRSGAGAAMAGTALGLSAALVIGALIHFAVPISQVAPLMSANPLVSVALGLWIFAEWKEANLRRVLLGAALIVAGGFLVSAA